jgi:D-threonate/D-erythronate kinase
MSGFAVVADDLTGALVSATRLRQRGLTVEVLWRRDQVSPSLSVDAVVVDMRTRDAGHGHLEQAKAWGRSLIAAGYGRLECRMDSTLRGHAREELAGIVAAFGHTRPLVLAVPASPSAGRTTKRGVQQVHNPSSGTRFAVDVPGVIFGRSAHLVVDSPMIAAGGRHIAERILGARTRSGPTCVVADGEHDRDLAVIAHAANLLAASGQHLITLSPGAWLAHYPRLDDGDFTLVVVGSPTRENLSQQAEFQALPHACVLRPVEVLDRPDDRLSAGLRPGATVIISTVPDQPDVIRSGEHAKLAATAAVAVLNEAADRGMRCSRLVVTGGHAAQLVIDALGVTGLWPLDQVGPMCSRARISGGRWDGLALVMKGGQVGDARTLVALAAGGEGASSAELIHAETVGAAPGGEAG